MEFYFDAFTYSVREQDDFGYSPIITIINLYRGNVDIQLLVSAYESNKDSIIQS